MTGRESLLATIRGEVVDRLPWAPRIDLWYNAHHQEGTLPEKWANTSMWDVIRELGGLLYTPGVLLWREELPSVEVVVTEQDGVTHSQYRTPVGTVSTTFMMTPDMQGAKVAYQTEHMIKGEDDYRVVEYIVGHTEYLPAYEEIAGLIKEFGDEGIPIGSTGISPIHWLLKDLIGYGNCFYEMCDHPREFERLLQLLIERHWEIKEIAAASPAEIVLIDANFSDTITSPPIFKKYFLPYLAKCADILHARGKFVTCHVDGDMKWLLGLFLETGVDIAEALSPDPLCNYTLAEARAAWGDRVTIWGGIPATLFTPLYDDDRFEGYVRDIFRTIAPGDHFILSTGDNVPPDGIIERLYRVTQVVEELGPLPIDPLK